MTVYKPWESIPPMLSQPFPSSFNTINNGFMSTNESIRTHGVNPPPPPRIIQQPQSIGVYPVTNYSNPYHGQQPTSYNNYYSNQSNTPKSNFTQIALEESRSAFNSIESIIQTFHSITSMFETTFTNIHTSFRTMIDLFDHFTRLRSELTTLYPLVLFWRFFKHIFNRLLKIFHLRKTKNIEDSWTTIYNSLQQTTESTEKVHKQSSSLLVALFFIVSFGTPMLMLKFLNSTIKKRQMNNNWMQQEKNQACVVALYDYVARNSDELSFTRGTTIYLAPSAYQSTKSCWFLGTIDHIHTGLIPANYVQPVRTKNSSNTTFQSQTPYNVNSDNSSPHVPSVNTNISQSTSQGEEQAIIS
ncbi:unnamed protein product [Adineta steineri]|uniref:Peroxisomal membrane protein PEX13 n=2 Tax=Adineta steineri TaxID=433720 RepID=A0A814U487_9BILA|nr:unnamed protein product [Adineta steineri]